MISTFFLKCPDCQSGLRCVYNLSTVATTIVRRTCFRGCGARWNLVISPLPEIKQGQPFRLEWAMVGVNRKVAAEYVERVSP